MFSWASRKRIVATGRSSLKPTGKSNPGGGYREDRLIFGKKTRILSYDPDRTGSKVAVRIAKFDKAAKLGLTDKDFFVV